MTKFSENEKETFQTILADYEMRTDGRKNLETRSYKVVLDFLPSTLSSLKLIYGNNSKEILFAIKVIIFLIIGGRC